MSTNLPSDRIIDVYFKCMNGVCLLKCCPSNVEADDSNEFDGRVDVDGGKGRGVEEGSCAGIVRLNVCNAKVNNGKKSEVSKGLDRYTFGPNDLHFET